MLTSVLLLIALPSATLQGTVRSVESSAPIPFATVRVLELGRGVLADENGVFTVTDLPAGRWTVRAEAMGFRPHALALRVPDSGEIRIEFELKPAPLEISGIEVLTTRTGGTRQASGGARELFDREVVPGAVSVSRSDLGLIPEPVEVDVLRSLQAMPGVVALNDLSAELHVRGGGPDQNLFLWDDARLFAPYHLFGIVSAFNADAVERVEFYRGALPARRGGALSSVVAVESAYNTGSPTQVDGGVSLLGVRVTAKGAIPSYDGQWTLAGRRTHADLVAEKVLGTEFPYAFHDIQGGISLAPEPDQRIRASFFASGDRFQMPFGSNRLSSGWRNRAGSLLWQHADGGGWALEALGWISTYRTRLAVGDEAAAGVTRNQLKVGGVKLEAARQGFAAGIRVGLDLEAGDVALYGSNVPGAYVSGQREQSYQRAAIFVEAEQWVGRVRLAPGLRIAHELQAQRAFVEPRLAARFHMSEGLSLTFGAGRVYQDLSTLRDDRNVLPGAPLWMLHAPEAPASRSDGVDVEVQRWLGREWNLRLAGYARRLTDLPRWRPEGDRTLEAIAYDDGNAVGLEASLNRHAGRVTGWLGYGLSRTRLTEQESGRAYDAAWDRRHSVDGALSYHLSDRFSVSAHAVYGSGLPFWPVAGYTEAYRLNPLAGRLDWEVFTPVWANEQMRYPSYIRLDMGARSRFKIARAQVEPYISVLNVTRRPNVLYYEPQRSGAESPTQDWASETRLAPVNAFPFSLLPSVGIDVRF